MPYKLRISTSGYICEETKNTNFKKHMRPYVYCSIIYNNQTMEAALVPINCQVVRKNRGTYTYTMLLGHKEEWNLTICDSLPGPRGRSAKWNKSDRERQISCHFTCMWNLKNKINEQAKLKQIDRLIFARGREVKRWRRGLEVQIGSYKIVMGCEAQHREYSQ